MSIQVKTPTRTQFEHVQFPCGEKQTTTPDGVSATITISSKTNMTLEGSLSIDDGQLQRPNFIGSDVAAVRGGRKRRQSERSIGPAPGNVNHYAKRKASFSGGRHTLTKIVPPTKFLLGGNITDPLNLNSLCDEEINAALNEHTPQSSPLPMPAHRSQQPIHVFIPANIHDPLNLNSGEDVDVNLISPKCGRKKRNKHKNRKRLSAVDGQVGEGFEEVAEGDQGEELPKDQEEDNNIPAPVDKKEETAEIEEPAVPEVKSATVASLESKIKNLSDKIVSPVIPQISPKSKKRKRTSGELKLEDLPSTASIPSARSDSSRSSKDDKYSPRRKYKKQISTNQSNTSQQPAKFRRRDAKFIYGNYNRYYGYRNPAKEEDNRISGFEREWFDNKDVLDIGCNVGHMTLTLARDYTPHFILGIDIDPHLIAAARQNIRHYLAGGITNKFPASLSVTRGPLAAPLLPKEGEPIQFPHNISFIQANYVLETDELLSMQKEEYDTILALSITKWVHLNWCDAGLKRFFKRIYKQLRPGGQLILEPQAWPSYKKKKKLTEDIFCNYQTIQLKPEQFTEYLLSKEVGFGTCRQLRMPFNKSKGFQRSVYIFTKSDTELSTPRPGIDSTGATPSIICTSGRPTPHFDIGSSGVTPCSSCRNTPNYPWSAGTTPRCPLCCGTSRSGSTSATPASEWSKSMDLTPDRLVTVASPECMEDLQDDDTCGTGIPVILPKEPVDMPKDVVVPPTDLAVLSHDSVIPQEGVASPASKTETDGVDSNNLSR